MSETAAEAPAISVLLPTLNEAGNIGGLIRNIKDVLTDLGVTHEVLVVDAGSTDSTQDEAIGAGARVVTVPRGYGVAIRGGIAAARGRYVLTMDADLSHDASFIRALWSARDPHAIGIASRYVSGGSSRTSRWRHVLSRLLNVFFGRGLSLPVKDLSSGYRLYPQAAFHELELASRDFDILPEILVRAYSQGWRVYEVPFHYVPRATGQSKARVLRLGIEYVSTFARLWRLRNSIESADYDERAFDSVIPLQRAWQRRRYSVITKQVPANGMLLDVGCGSSRILKDLRHAVGVDLAFRKLRYMRRYGIRVVHADIFGLPFRDASFDTAVCSEVIEHIPAGAGPFMELARVLRPKGLLILGTPDYGRRSWRTIEAIYRLLAPGGYADEHITQYDHATLVDYVQPFGFKHLRSEYVFGSEMILTFRRD